MTATLDALEAEAATCTACELRATASRVVPGDGPADARVVLVGEAPGRTEDEEGRPFVGRSGRLLLDLVAAELGLERSDVFITNAVRCRPPGNATPTTAQRTTCRRWLAAELELLDPAVVVGVGAVASRILLDRPITMAASHGRALHGEIVGAPIVPAYHPAAALRGGPTVLDALRGDLRAVGTILADGAS
jgi:DNA polymerase